MTRNRQMPLQRRSFHQQEEPVPSLRAKHASQDDSGPLMLHDESDMTMLQSQVGNLGVQQVLQHNMIGTGMLDSAMAVQRAEQAEPASETEPAEEDEQAPQASMAPDPAAEQENDPEDPIEVGDISIEEPNVETYDVTGETAAEAITQIRSPDEWFKVEKFDYKLETNPDGTVEEVHIEVKEVTVYVPEWTSFDDADVFNQSQWLQAVGPFNEYYIFDELEHPGAIPMIAVGANFQGDDPPEGDVKDIWKDFLEDVHDKEETLRDMIYRQVLTAQQRLLGQPEGKAATILDEIFKDFEAKDFEEYQEAHEELIKGSSPDEVKDDVAADKLTI